MIEDPGVLEEITLLDHLFEGRTVDKEIVLAILLSGTPAPGSVRNRNRHIHTIFR